MIGLPSCHHPGVLAPLGTDPGILHRIATLIASCAVNHRVLQVVHVQVVVHAVGVEVDRWHFFFQTIDMAVVVVRQFARFQEAHVTCRKRKHISEEAERNGAVDDPGRPFEVGRGRAFVVVAGIHAQPT
jgi:hypothetical protein